MAKAPWVRSSWSFKNLKSRPQFRTRPHLRSTVATAGKSTPFYHTVSFLTMSIFAQVNRHKDLGPLTGCPAADAKTLLNRLDQIPTMQNQLELTSALGLPIPPCSNPFHGYVPHLVRNWPGLTIALRRMRHKVAGF